MRTKVTLFLALFTASSAFCAVDIENVTFGFNNGYKQGKWAPLNVTVRSQNEPVPFSGKLTVEVRNVYSDEPIYRYATSLQLSKTDQKQKKLYVYCPRSSVQFFIQLVRSVPHATQEMVPPAPIENKDYFVLVLAPNGDKLQKIIDKKRLDDDATHVHIKYLPNSRSMPTKWIGYSAVDLVIIRETSLTDKRILRQQQTALLDWVQRGGTLIVSGGSNFRFLKNSFIEQLLPVKLSREETIEKVPTILRQQFGFSPENGSSAHVISNNAMSPYKSIHFEPKLNCHILLGTQGQIYIAKRNFGSGQIIVFAFDYNAPPFSDVQAGETFWRWLLKTHGKSSKRFADQYAPFRQHEEKIHEQFLSKMPTQIPLIKLLAVVLPIYLLSFGGLILYFEKRGRSENRIRGYWIGGLIFVFISVSAISVARAVLPKQIETDQFSILSIYPEQKSAHLQMYTSLRTAAHNKTSIALEQNTFIRPLRTETIAKPPQFFQGTPFQLQEVSLEPWSPNTYVQEAFFSLGTQQSQITLENAWKITGQEATDLGTVKIGSSNLWVPELPSKTVNKVPLDEVAQTGKFMLHGLEGTRKAFAKILQQEGLLQYLLKQENTLTVDKVQNRTVLIGWISELAQDSTVIPRMSDAEIVTDKSEILVIMYLDEMDSSM